MMQIRKNVLPFLACIAALACPLAASDAHKELAANVYERERQTIQYLSTLRPVVQIYLQSTKDSGEPAHGDVYFLGEWNVGTVLQSDMTHRVMPHVALIAGQHERTLGSIVGGNKYTFHADDLTQMFFVDASYFLPDYYSLVYVKEEVLSGHRCVVFDVAPIPANAIGRVQGRIWVDPETASIIRIHAHFTGELNRQDGNPEFDSWRWKTASGFWVPSYLYSESTAANPADNLALLRMRMSIEVWGYDRKLAEARSPNPLPRLQRREQQVDAPPESKIVRWLSDNALIAPPGETDQAICAVARKLMASSNLPQRPIACRVLMSSPVESFTVGDTIVLSRGLLDLLPDEPALAAVIAHEIAHILLGHTDPPSIAAEGDIFAQGRVPGALKFHTNPAQEKAARALAATLVENSPYAGTLDRLLEFAAAVRERRSETPRVLQARFGGQIAEELIALAQATQAAKSVQPGALALGSRIETEPSTGALTFATKYRGIASRTFPLGVAARIPALEPEHTAASATIAPEAVRSASPN